MTWRPRRASAGKVRHIYLLRIVGLVLGGICVAAVFHERGAAPVAWGLLGLYVIVWPHLAILHTLRSQPPRRAENRNLMVDSLMGGVWIALMQFSLLPSVVLASMLSTGNTGFGGWRLLLSGLVAMLVGGGVTALLVGAPINPEVSMFVLSATLPVLIGFPLMFGLVMHGLARNLARQRREFERLSRTDSLSGLYNRLLWDEWVTAEFAQLQRHGGEAALLLLDIDRFKDYNDTWGPDAGDDAIRHVARVLRGECRREDWIARYGGEEFGVLLPEIDRERALAAAERLRARVGRADSDFAGLTVSIGVAPFDPVLVDGEEWMLRAEKALYAAKRAGRNCCVVTEPTAESAPRSTPRTA
ncbi:diguanylate cyclase [Halofilum ochraceum]|uniref:diguanylate cyclase n=1 Tax=Halofilum ochraceum TaxID=1611323 RepID=UPI0008D96C9F|nr:diguanylate cyclase [Halofilum ochraceum]